MTDEDIEEIVEEAMTGTPGQIAAICRRLLQALGPDVLWQIIDAAERNHGEDRRTASAVRSLRALAFAADECQRSHATLCTDPDCKVSAEVYARGH